MTQVGLSSLCVYQWFANRLGAYLTVYIRKRARATGLGITIAPNVKTVLELCLNE